MAAVGGSGASTGGEPRATDRLDSWKEIAAYLRRSERTVRRWEHTLHLPVHRLSASKRANVFALKSELDNWWEKCGQNGNGPPSNGEGVTKPRRRNWVWAGAVLAAVSALFGVANVTNRLAPKVTPVWKQITFDTGYTAEPAISRDGALIVYASDRAGRGDRDIYVQRLEGGQATRLTDHEAHDCRPDVSPDGSQVVFHSYGDAIYRVATSGGTPMRLSSGDYPRFSPDGGRVAFDDVLPDGTFAVFTVPASGGPVTRVSPPSFCRARRPVWSPDGKRILFMGATQARPQEYDWWAVAAEGGDPVRTGVSAQLIRQGWPGLRFLHAPLERIGDRVWFFYSDSASGHLWRIPLTSGTSQVAGSAEQFTSGAGRERELRIAAGAGKEHIAVAVSESVETQLWEFAIDPENAVLEERGRQVTQDASILAGFRDTRPSLSADGARLAYASRRTGNYDVWLHDLTTGEERLLANSPRDEVDPILAHDGSAVIFVRQEETRQPLILAPADGSRPREVCDDCGIPTDWSSDGRHVLYVSRSEKLGLLDLATGNRSELRSSVRVLSGTFSPDGRTVAAGARFGEIEQVYMMAFERGRLASQEHWKPLSQPYASVAVWSPSGRVVYFLAFEEEYRCLWAQRLDPETRQTIGSPIAVRHFHSMAQDLGTSRWLAMTRNKLVLRPSRRRSNIWSTEIN